MFITGDVVQLKSFTGPKLVVTKVSSSSIKCIWFCESSSKYKKQKFHPDLLIKTDSLNMPNSIDLLNKMSASLQTDNYSSYQQTPCIMDR